MSIKQNLAAHFRNLRGPRLAEKIVVFSVDDYGNVRLASAKARANLDQAGFKVQSRFDALDSLETSDDLQALFEVLTSVQDKAGSAAVFSPFALPANIDFDAVLERPDEGYQYELLPETFKKTMPNSDVWNVWQEGIRSGIFVPHSHGREHLNVTFFNHLCTDYTSKIVQILKEKSYTSIDFFKTPNVSYTAAFDFENASEIPALKQIAADGLLCFEQVFGFKTTYFNPPGGREHSDLHQTLAQNGIKFMDTPFLKKVHQGSGRYAKTYHHFGQQTKFKQTLFLRNVVFEPTYNNGTNWVDKAMTEIETAFLWKKPAIISSHRVNFSGAINENNRTEGLYLLKKLLVNILKKWPDVRFMTAQDLGQYLTKEKNNV